MELKDFDYNLPKNLIAKTPLKKRGQSRLLIMDKDNGGFIHKQFDFLLKILRPGDTLVLNNSMVIPARLFCVDFVGNRKFEILVTKQLTQYKWKAIGKPARRIEPGMKLTIVDSTATLSIVSNEGNGEFIVKFDDEEFINKYGNIPLPPYVDQNLTDQTKYQTVYASLPGSIAAPTAGLHFTKSLLSKLENIGVEILFVTLHIGIVTFLPVRVENVLNHKMHEEYFVLDKITAEKINYSKKRGSRIFAVGTTVTRLLEYAMIVSNKQGSKELKPITGSTDLFIVPGFQFQVIDGLITNFHLPKSTLLMLVSAFISREYLFTAYKEAIKLKYRFYSFGDAMLIK